MSRRRLLILLLAGISWFLPKVWGQYPVVPPGFGPPGQLPPLLYVRLAGPEGMKVTFYRAGFKPQTFDTPCVIGVRPGYSYRMALSDIPGMEKLTFYPTLDVRASLIMGDKLRNADFPATLRFSREEFNKVLGHATLKKVLVLEMPDRAIPEATKADQPIEILLEANRDPFTEARTHGAPMAILHLGERTMNPEDLVVVPGTLLFPGEKVLPAPRVGPWLPWGCFPVDPRAGTAPPANFMALEDGGDFGLLAGVDRFKGPRGVDPTDTVATYQDSRGRNRVACSNRVALCVPRFLIVTGETQLGNSTVAQGPGGNVRYQGFKIIDVQRQLAESSQKTLLEKASGTQRLSANSNTAGTAVIGKIQGLDVVGTFRTTGTVDSSHAAPQAVEPEDGPLCIIKWPDKMGGLVGDVITFTLKYTNLGGQPITNINVLDSLGTRFEYVPGSAKADREAFFTTELNDAGSLLLRWEIQGRLLPRDSGLVSFKVKIR